MSNTCDLKEVDGEYVCSNCGKSYKQLVKAACPKKRRKPCSHLGDPTGESFPPPEGAGNLISSALSKIGVTKKRFSRLITLGKSETGCNCNWRIGAVNWIGSWLGLPGGMSGELQDLVTMEEIAKQDLHHCGYFQQSCLPNLHLTQDGETRREMARAGFRLCHGCQHRENAQNSQ